MRGFAGLLVVCAAAGCTSAASMSASEPPSPTEAAVAESKTIDVRDVGGAWRADARWASRVDAVESAGDVALERVRAATGIEFAAGRGPVVEFDEVAPTAGDVALRFVDGVRRPVTRIQPRALLSGEFAVPSDFATLVARGAIVARAGEREPPTWVTRGVALVVADSFDLELHRRALGGKSPLYLQSDLFGDVASDPLAGAARAKAIVRCARSERPFVRFLDTLFSGKSEDAALAEVGISRRDLLDAATDTERAHATKAIAEDPSLPALTAARAALARHATDEADAAIAPVVPTLGDAGRDPWIAADARLCLAQIAMARGDEKSAADPLDAAQSSSKVVRVRDARIVEAWVLTRRGDAAAWPQLLHDFPDLPK
jgi:hypothetical protein